MASCNRLIFPDLREPLVALRLVVVVARGEVELVAAPNGDDIFGHFGVEDVGAHMPYIIGFGGGPDHYGEGVDAIVEKAVGVWSFDELLGFFFVRAVKKGTIEVDDYKEVLRLFDARRRKT